MGAIVRVFDTRAAVAEQVRTHPTPPKLQGRAALKGLGAGQAPPHSGVGMAKMMLHAV